MSEKAEEFANVVKELSESSDKVIITTHANPDPDALGAAFGIKWLLAKLINTPCEICYEGEISHRQNRTMVNVLDIMASPVSDTPISTDAQDPPIIIIVDATPLNAPNAYSKSEKMMIIDHHRVEEPAAAFCHIDPVGASSTLVYEYLYKLGFREELAEEATQAVATALLFGIQVDTQNLISETTTSRDFSAYQSLVSDIDRIKLHKIVNYPHPSYYYELEQEMSKDGNHQIDGSVYVGCVGVISKAQRDVLPMLADKMVRMESIDTAVVFGIVNDCVEACLRTQNSARDVSQFAQLIFGKGNAGGKLGSGAAKVPLGIMSVSDAPADLKEQIWAIVRDKVIHKIFHVAGDNS